MKKKIIIIEDDADIRGVITYILQEQGFTIISMSSPESLDIMVDQQPDLVLIDEWISYYPGHRLCLRIKQFHRLMHVPVIILSTSKDILNIMTECKADGYVRKPFDVAELVEAVQAQLLKRA